MQHEKKQKAETDQLLWRTIAGGRQKVWYWVLQEISQYDRPTIGATLAKFDNLFHKWKRIFLPGTGRPPRPLEIQYFCHILNWKLKKKTKAWKPFEPLSQPILFFASFCIWSKTQTRNYFPLNWHFGRLLHVFLLDISFLRIEIQFDFRYQNIFFNRKNILSFGRNILQVVQAGEMQK